MTKNIENSIETKKVVGRIRKAGLRISYVR